MAVKLQQQSGSEGLARELGQSIILLALTGSSVGGFLGMVAIAAHALGR